jgi:alkaline phosphatase
MEFTSSKLVEKLDGKIFPRDTKEIQEIFKEWWNIDVTKDDIEAMAVYDEDIHKLMLSDSYSISEYVSAKFTVFGWTTHGHNGEDVPLWAYGPNAPSGVIDNTEIATKIAEALGFSLDDLNEELFVDVEVAYGDDISTPEGALYLNMEDSNNPVLEITISSNLYTLETSKDILVTPSSEVDLNGIVVYAPQLDTVFIPQEAVDLIA